MKGTIEKPTSPHSGLAGYSLVIPQTEISGGPPPAHASENVGMMRFSLVRPRGLEPLASCSGGKRSIR